MSVFPNIIYVVLTQLWIELSYRNLVGVEIDLDIVKRVFSLNGSRRGGIDFQLYGRHLETWI